MSKKAYSINGIKYNLEVILENEEENAIFHIRAKCKYNRRTSCINNLNPILSELGVNPEDSRFGDSIWEFSKKEAEVFFDVAVESLSNTSFRKYIEDKLDEDRECGEWENSY